MQFPQEDLDLSLSEIETLAKELLACAGLERDQVQRPQTNRA
jgi:hypothetical protein